MRKLFPEQARLLGIVQKIRDPFMSTDARYFNERLPDAYSLSSQSTQFPS